MSALHSPSVSSRYLLDLAPAVAALLVVTWRAAATWALEASGAAPVGNLARFVAALPLGAVATFVVVAVLDGDLA